MSEILKIFVPTHNVSIKDNDTFVPIQVGAELHKDMDLCPLKDNTGDNISDRNDQARFNGFTSERIGSAWFLFNHFDIHSYPYVWNNKYDISQTPVDYLHVSSRRFNPLIIRNNINRVHNIGLAHNNRAAIIRRFIKK